MKSLPVKFLPKDTVYFMYKNKVIVGTVGSVSKSLYGDHSESSVCRIEGYSSDENWIELSEDKLFTSFEELVIDLRDQIVGLKKGERLKL